jgi:hypothetical protein
MPQEIFDMIMSNLCDLRDVCNLVAATGRKPARNYFPTMFLTDVTCDPSAIVPFTGLYYLYANLQIFVDYAYFLQFKCYKCQVFNCSCLKNHLNTDNCEECNDFCHERVFYHKREPCSYTLKMNVKFINETEAEMFKNHNGLITAIAKYLFNLKDTRNWLYRKMLFVNVFSLK